MKTRRRSPSRSKNSGLTTFVRVTRFGALAAVALALPPAPSPLEPLPGEGRCPAPRGSRHGSPLPIHGIDISKWQGEIDWAALRQAGTKFAFIKATEGGDHIDGRFLENWQAARRAGVPRGAYHFVYWCRPAHEQAAWFKRNVPQDPDALPRCSTWSGTASP